MNLVEIISLYRLEIIIGFLSIIILYLLYYMYEKDTRDSKQIRSIASVVEELNRDIFYLRNKLSETTKKLDNQTSRMSDEDIYQEIERSVYDMIKPLALTLKEVQDTIATIDNRIENRITTLENGVKQINIPSSIHANDDEKIISLYQQGLSVETIAKELHLAKPEVEFVLKINQIK